MPNPLYKNSEDCHGVMSARVKPSVYINIRNFTYTFCAKSRQSIFCEKW